MKGDSRLTNINKTIIVKMKKHIHILGLVLTSACLISSLIAKDDLFTICGWFSATMGAFSTLLYFKITEMNKDN